MSTTPTTHMAFTFALAAEGGPYDERSVLPDDLDIRLTLSRNDRPQPFHLICENDTVLVSVVGSGRVEFEDSSVRYYDYGAGDVVYVPAGTPHRIVPDTKSVHHRFKLPESELEGVAWYCAGCGRELHRDVFALEEELPQEGYLRACKAFNGDADLRRCGGCGDMHPELDLGGYRWEAIARERRSAEAGGAANERE